MTREFIRLETFEKQCKKVGLTEDDVLAIEIILLDNPTVGDIIQGTGGFRKFRYPLPNIYSKTAPILYRKKYNHSKFPTCGADWL